MNTARHSVITHPQDTFEHSKRPCTETQTAALSVWCLPTTSHVLPVSRRPCFARLSHSRSVSAIASPPPVSSAGACVCRSRPVAGYYRLCAPSSTHAPYCRGSLAVSSHSESATITLHHLQHVWFNNIITIYKHLLVPCKIATKKICYSKLINITMKLRLHSKLASS